MSKLLMILGAVSTLWLGVAVASAATPAAAAEAPAVVSAWSVGEEPAPVAPGSMDSGPTCQGPMHQGPMHQGPMHQGPPRGPAEAGKARLAWMTHVLGLSVEQKTAVGTVLEQQRTETDALQRQLRDGGKKLAEALAAAKPVPATVGTLMIEQRTLMQKLEATQDQADQALRALLTAEQKATLAWRPRPGARGWIGYGGGPRGLGRGPMGRQRGMAPPPMGPPPVAPGPELPDVDWP